MMNAYVLNWTMNNCEQLKKDLNNNQFQHEEESGTKHIRVCVPFKELEKFASIAQTHLNTPYNYVDVQFPDEGITTVIFSQKIFMINNSQQNEQVKEWAIEQGLPIEQADWGISYHE